MKKETREIRNYNSAKNLFIKFNNGEISLSDFTNALCKLATLMDLSKEQLNAFVNDYIISQTNAYKLNPRKYGYLLSVYSSGSLLTQFQPQED